ncbi:MAG TPA: hypothetical protein VGK14_13605 [Novimethylophilus sp.]|jgi:hypothetical protein|uniref:hypothetical protein n=1 Tax=Novimethylophilus sp. TaxID=2137426 RepID=UPI002F3FD4E8
MIVFFDTEFTDLLPADLGDPALISIGLVTQSGDKTFYAELADTWTKQQCSSFVTEAVLPHLEGGAAVMHLEEMRSRLQSWITSFDEPVILVSDNVVDWEWFYNLNLGTNNITGWQLFRPELAKPGQAKHEAMRAIEQYHQKHPWHHALHDAIGLQQAWFATRSSGWEPAWLRT